MNMHIGRKGTPGSQARSQSRVKLGLISGLLTLFAGQVSAAPGVLSQGPLFLAAPVQPNIFFMLDDSGSMDWEVLRRSDGGGSGNLDFTPDYTTEQLELCVGYNVLAYDPTTLTDPQKEPYTPWFGLDRNGNAFTDVSPTNAPVNPYTGTAGGTGGCDNNGEVNNDNGRACNLVTGFGGNGAHYYVWTDANNNEEYDNGECATGTPIFVSSLTAAQQTNFANWFSYYRKREYVMKRAVTEIADGSTERMGFGTINRNNHVTKGTEVGTQVRDIDDLTVPINATAAANKATLLDNLLGVNSNSFTPLRLGLEHTGQYFMDQMTNTSLFGYVPAADPDSASGSSPILDASLGGTCQQNFAIVMSDGFWNGGDPTIGDTDSDGPGPFDGQSYGAAAARTLADVAMNYYETDLLPIADEVPIVSIDVAPGDATECASVAPSNASLHPNCYDTNTAQHLVTYTVAFGVRGTIPENDTSGNPCVPNSRDDTLATQNWPNVCDPTAGLGTGWPVPVSNGTTTVDDMMHAAWNGRGQFLSAKNPAELINSLQNAIDDISSKNPVAAAAVAVDSSSIVGGGNVVQGKFDSSYWSGELYSYAVTATTVSTTPTWAAHDLLDARGYSTRIAVTYNGTTAIPFNFPADYTISTNFGVTEISQDQLNDLMYDSPNPVTTTDPVQIAENQAYGEDLVAYLLGDPTNEGKTVGKLRDRDSHKLGDIIHSSPVYVGDPDPDLYADSSYQVWANYPTPSGANGRREMIYVGANDGGLHAFDATTGEEVFVYFPKAVFSDEKRWGLHYLANRGYEHRYYVDGEVTVAEVYADFDGTGDKWSTILVGTLRGGGRSIFAIDISDPSEFTTAAGVASNILWEFSHDELGFTYSTPTVAKMNNGRWAAIFGNGYIQGATATGEAVLFIKYLDNASPGYHMISTGVGSNLASDCLNAGSDCNGLSTPAVVDLGGDGIADRVYAGDIMGNLWAFDISSATPASWGLAFTAAPLISAKTSGAVSQPITSQPAVILHPTERHSNTSPNTMVFFGTGQYIADNDPISTATNTFYGVWDTGTAVTSARNVALVEQTISADTLGSDDIRIMTNNPVDYTTHRGWFVDLPDTGERVIAYPIVFGDVVVYNTIVPESNLCSSSGGYSWLMVHSLIDGSEPDFIALDVSGDGVFDSSDQKDGRNVTGKKSGALNWQMTLAKSGAGAEATAFIPAQDIDTVKIRGDRLIGTRSSWGRYMMDE